MAENIRGHFLISWISGQSERGLFLRAATHIIILVRNAGGRVACCAHTLSLFSLQRPSVCAARRTRTRTLRTTLRLRCAHHTFTTRAACAAAWRQTAACSLLLVDNAYSFMHSLQTPFILDCFQTFRSAPFPNTPGDTSPSHCCLLFPRATSFHPMPPHHPAPH